MENMENILPLKCGDAHIVAITSLIELNDDCCVSGTVYGTTERRRHMGTPLFITWYLHLLGKEPLVTKMFTIGLVAMMGDAIAQLLQGTWVLPLKWHQMGSKLVIGFTLTAPMYHYLYMFLEDWLPAVNGKNRFIHLSVDQIVAVPIWIVSFFLLDSVMKNPFTALSENGGRIHRQFISVLCTSWIIYPFIQYLNYTYVPVRLRIFILIGVSVVFNTNLSYLGSGTGGSSWKIEHLLIQ